MTPPDRFPPRFTHTTKYDNGIDDDVSEEYLSVTEHNALLAEVRQKLGQCEAMYEVISEAEHKYVDMITEAAAKAWEEAAAALGCDTSIEEGKERIVYSASKYTYEMFMDKARAIRSGEGD